MQWLSSAVWQLLTDIFIRLWYAYQDLSDIKDKIYATSWIPNILGDLFYSVAWQFHEWYYKVRDMRAEFQHYTDYLNDLWEGSGLNAVLTRLWWEWEALRRDAKGFISGKLDEMIPEFYKLKSDPAAWITSRIYVWDPDVWQWLVHPVEALRMIFDRKYIGIWSFFERPVEVIIAWIQEWNYDAYNWLKYPDTMMKRWIEDVFGIPYGFWLDPWGEGFRLLTQWVEDHLENVRPYIIHVGEKVARYIWAREL